MKRLFLIGPICLAMALGIFINGAQVADAAQTVLKLGHITAPGGLLDKHAQKFKELVSIKSKGAVRIDVYPAAQLGKMGKILEGLTMGTVDMALESLGFLSRFNKDINFYNLSFLWKNAQEIMDDNYLREVLEKIRKKNNIRTLAYNGVRPALHLWTYTKPVQSLDELKGMKLRVPPSKAYVACWNGLGAIAVAIPWSEVYMSLAQHVVDGMTHNCLQIRDEHFYEHLRYVTLLDFKPTLSCIWISDSKHKSLSPDIQKLLSEAAIEAGNYFSKIAKQGDLEAWEQVKKSGIKVYTTDRDPWFKKAHGVIKELEEKGTWSKGLLKKAGK